MLPAVEEALMSPALSKCRVVIVPATTGVLGEPVFPQPQFDSSMLEGIGEVARQVRPARMLSFARGICALPLELPVSRWSGGPLQDLSVAAAHQRVSY